MALVESHARGAYDVLQNQCGLANVLGFHPHKTRLNFGEVIQAQLFQLIHCWLRRGGEHGAVLVILTLAAVDDRLCDCLATAAATRFILPL